MQLASEPPERIAPRGRSLLQLLQVAEQGAGHQVVRFSRQLVAQGGQRTAASIRSSRTRSMEQWNDSEKLPSPRGFERELLMCVPFVACPRAVLPENGCDADLVQRLR